jgi:predicted nucleic acid-binding Zn ribbon protein
MPDDARAIEALTRIDSHEKVCAERYGEIKGSFDRVHTRLDKILYGIIGLLVTMVGYLIVVGRPWEHGG